MITWAERAKAAIAKTAQGGSAKTDETPILRLLAVSAVASTAVPVMPERLLAVLAVPTPTVFKKSADWHALDAAYLAHHFKCPTCIAAGRGNRYGLRCDMGDALWSAYELADDLVLRHQEQDPRRRSLECRHLAEHGAGSWSCGDWQAAVVSSYSHDAQLTADLAM